MDEATSRLVISSLEATWADQDDAVRRDEARKRLDVRRGKAIKLGLVKPFPYESDADFASRGKFAVGFFAFMIKVLNFLYDIPPGRVLSDDSSSARASWRRVLWDFGDGLDCVASTALGLAKTCGVCLAYPCYLPRAGYQPDVDSTGLATAGDTGDGSDDGVAWRLATPDRACVVVSPWDPAAAWGVAIRIGKITETRANGTTAKGSLFLVWTRSHYAEMFAPDGPAGLTPWEYRPSLGGDGSYAEIHEHGYRDMPVIALRREIDPARTSYWSDGIGGDDLMQSLSALFSAWSAYIWTAQLQRGQPYCSGGGIKGSPALGPTVVIETEEGATFGIAPNGGELNGQKECLLASLAAIGKTCGLPSRAMRLDDSSAQSGLAIALDRGELEDERRSDEKTWAVHELALHRVSAECYANGRALRGRDPVRLAPLAATQFHAHVVALTAADARENVRLELDARTMGKLEAKMTLQPQLDRARAEELLLLAEADAPEELPAEHTGRAEIVLG